MKIFGPSNLPEVIYAKCKRQSSTPHEVDKGIIGIPWRFVGSVLDDCDKMIIIIKQIELILGVPSAYIEVMFTVSFSPLCVQ